MKNQYKVLMLGLCLFFFLPSLKAQDSAVLVKDSVYWNVEYGSLDQTGMNQIFWYESYWLAGDTLLNGKFYRKVCPYKTSAEGLMREENRKVYYRDLEHSFTSDTSEILCYDYNLKIGDTFRLTEKIRAYNDTSLHLDTVLFVLRDTSSVTLLTGEHKTVRILGCIYNNDMDVLHFMPESFNQYGYQWIDGIGSNIHPLYFLPYNIGFNESWIGLSCAYLKGQKIYGDYGRECYYTYTSIDNKLPPASNTFLYPNPAHDRLYMENAAFSSVPVSANIYNIAGQRVLSYDKPLWPLDISTLPKGLYILQLQGSQGVVEEKFLKE